MSISCPRLRLDRKDLATILDYGPATAPNFPPDCALCRQSRDEKRQIATGLAGNILALEGKGDYWICQQCSRRLGIPEDA